MMFFIITVLLLLWVFDVYVMQPKLAKLETIEAAKQAAKNPENLKPLSDMREKKEVLPLEKALATTKRVPLENDHLSGSINLTGGRIDDLSLSNYYKTLEKKEPVSLLSPKETRAPYYTEFGWVPEDTNIPVPGPETQWEVKDPSNNVKLTPENPVTLRWENGQGLTFEKIISLDKDFLFTVEQRVLNNTGSTVRLHPYSLISRHGIPENIENIWILHEGPIAYFNKELHQRSYSDLQDLKAPFSKPATDGWAGITDKYWMVSFLPEQKEPKTYRFLHIPPKQNTQSGRLGGPQSAAKPRYQVDMLGDMHVAGPGEQMTYKNRIFAGAKTVGLIEEYEKELNVPHFDLAVDFGWFYFITKPFFQAIHFFFELTGNFGVAIILFTCVLRLLVFPLANTSYKSFAKMKKLSPKIAEIREQYGNDKKQMQQALVKLYEKEKVNPLAGCFPILIQIPIFFSLYKVLYITIEMRHAPFFGWIQDLSAPDPTSLFNLFGLLPYGVPEFLQIGVWPCLMFVTLMIQQRLNPPPPDPTQRQIMMVFPFIITYIMALFPAGLVVYWTTSAALAIVQQLIIMRNMGVETHLFKRSKTDQELENSVEQGYDPRGEMIVHDVEEALGLEDDSSAKPEGSKADSDEDSDQETTVSKPKPKKKRKK